MIPLVLLAVQSSAAPSSAALPPPRFNDAIVAFCQNQIGKKVGSGQCAVLPQIAIQRAGARSRYADAPAEGDYVWGARIATVTARRREAPGVRAGDVVQFRDALFERRTPTYWSTSQMTHHTAVVASVAEDGRRLKLFEQNVNGRLSVGTSDLDLRELKSGTLWVYRAVAR